MGPRRPYEGFGSGLRVTRRETTVMARIVIADDGLEFDGATPERRPLGGAEAAFLSLAYREAMPRTEVPAPIAIFTSNPLRGLDWLLDLWAARIFRGVPGAEFHIYAGPQVYGAVGARKADEMSAILQRADALSEKGV